MDRISKILGRLKFSLFLLFMMLAIMAVYLVILLNNSAERLNTISAETSLTIFNSVIRREQEALGKLTKDYAYWTDSVEKLAMELEPEFIGDNFLGSYMGDSFGISHVVIARLDKTISMFIADGEVEGIPDNSLVKEPYQFLMQQALSADMTDPVPVTGFINMDSGLYIVACVPITPHNDQNPQFVFGQAYGLLLMTKKLDKVLIDDWARDFRFDSATLQMSEQVPEGYLSRVITNPLGKQVATIVWKPERPGVKFVSKNALTLFGFLLTLFLITGLFSVNIRRHIKMSLDTADKLEQSQLKLNELAYYDFVTGLPNRPLAMDRLTQSLNAIYRNKSHTAVMFVDLDGFKPVNDQYGHAMGDEVLIRVGQRLTDNLRKEETLARVGGDEFLVILPSLSDEQAIEVVAKKILNTVEKPYQIYDKQVVLSASIGIAVAPTDGMEAEKLIARADEAMYYSKYNGKNRYQFYSDMPST